MLCTSEEKRERAYLHDSAWRKVPGASKDIRRAVPFRGRLHGRMDDLACEWARAEELHNNYGYVNV